MGSASILLGVIGRPHGVRGQVHVHSYTERPEDLTAYGPLADATGRRFALRWTGRDIAEISELIDGQPRTLTDRTAAERLTNTQLFIARDALPAPEDDEFYLSDLIGLAAHAEDGAPLGTITTVHDYGAGASLEIAAPSAAPILVPFTRACVPGIDLAAGRMTIRLPDELIVEDASMEAAPMEAAPMERAR